MGEYPEGVTRAEAIAEVERRRVSDPEVTWLATERDGEWVVARIGLPPPAKPTGTATKPPPEPPLADPHSPIERAAWFAGSGG
jgi:hypothetical protein